MFVNPEMDLPASSSLSTLPSVKERMKAKINGTLKAVKLQTSLAGKIKRKNLNNSSILKVSLKLNNRELACALTAEKEKTRSLESDKMFLQKEIKMLHFQNALLRQNLSIVNKMLKNIDVCMNVNLPAAIEISNINELSDLSVTEEQKSERFSCESLLSLDEHQGFRLTGMPLRVPSRPSEQQKFSSVPAVLTEDEHLTVSLSPSNTFATESTDVQPDVLQPSHCTPKECLSTCDALPNVEISDFVLPQDKDLVASSISGRFVTKRRKRSTASRSSTQPVNLDINQTKISVGSCRESSHCTKFDDKDNALPPEPGLNENGMHNFVMTRNRSSSCSGIPCDGNRKSLCFSKTQNVLVTTDHTKIVHSSVSELHPFACPVDQEHTVYEADMEMTSSDSAAIVAILPKNKTKTSKSGIPRKQDGASLRKVKITAREKNKKVSSYTGRESNAKKDGEYKEESDHAINVSENMTAQLTSSKDFKSVLAERYNSRRTYVLTKSVNQDTTAIFESETRSDSKKELETSLINYKSEDSFTGINNICYMNDLSFAVDDMLSLEEQHYANITAPKRKLKALKERSKDMENMKKKKSKITEGSKDQEHTSEDTNTVTNEHILVQIDSSRETPTMESTVMKNRGPKIRRETYVVDSIKPDSMLDVKLFQDLTNKTFGLSNQSSISSLDQEEGVQGHSRRRRNPVNYKEPSLGAKLRRGDSGTNTEFLNLPISKGKGEKGGGKKKKVKSEECFAK